MEQYLICQYVGLQFFDNRFPICQTIFQHIQTDVHPVIGDWSSDNIKFVVKVNIFAVSQNKIQPYFIGSLKSFYMQFRMFKKIIRNLKCSYDTAACAAGTGNRAATFSASTPA